MSDPQTTAEYQPTRLGAGATTHLFLMLCVLAVGAFGAWSWYGKLDIVSDAVGEVEDDRAEVALMTMGFFFGRVLTGDEVLESWKVELSNVA